MCIVFFQQFDIDPPPSAALSPAEQAIAQRYAFVLASNRDEYFTRPTRRAHVWDPSHEEEEGEVVLAGKDLLGGGTWLGVTRSGRVAVLTNYRTPGDDAATATAAAGSGDGNGKRGDDGTAKAPAAGKKRSRGHLVLEYLHGKKGEARVGPLAYAERVVAEGSQYAGFNLVVADLKAAMLPPPQPAPSSSPRCSPAMVYVSNKADPPLQPLAPNRLCAMSNRLLDTPWDKLTRGKALFRDCLAQAAAEDDCDDDDAVARLFLHGLLNDARACTPATDTGYGLEIEGKLASICIPGVCLREGAPLFGTTTQMVVLARRDGRLRVFERTLQAGATEEEERRGLLPDWHWSEVERFELELM